MRCPAPSGKSFATCFTLLVLCPIVLLAQSPDSGTDEDEPVPREPLGPYGLCWESAPSMDYGGRSVASIQGMASGLIGRKVDKPAVAPAWDFPLAIGMLLVQHEVMGHGGRAREFSLDPSYGLGFDFSAYTTIDQSPESNEQNILLAAGGTEATGVLSRRLLLDVYAPGGGQGAVIPLLMMTKLDLPLYVIQTEEPEPGSDFLEQFESGNDMTIYLVSRQGLRAGANPVDVWERSYVIDFNDPLLERNFDELRLTALWNLLDPAVIMAVVDYFDRHIRGEQRVRPRTWQVAPRVGLTAGTRGALGIGELSRFLDVYAVTDWGVGNIYVRDLDSSVDRSWGGGIGFHRVPLGSRITLGAQGDWWDDPRSLERAEPDSGWHVGAEVDWMIQRNWGLTTKVGSKSEGFLPGTPSEKGTYAGFGVLFAF